MLLVAAHAKQHPGEPQPDLSAAERAELGAVPGACALLPPPPRFLPRGLNGGNTLASGHACLKRFTKFAAKANHYVDLDDFRAPVRPAWRPADLFGSRCSECMRGTALRVQGDPQGFCAKLPSTFDFFSLL